MCSPLTVFVAGIKYDVEVIGRLVQVCLSSIRKNLKSIRKSSIILSCQLTYLNTVVLFQIFNTLSLSHTVVSTGT